MRRLIPLFCTLLAAQAPAWAGPEAARPAPGPAERPMPAPVPAPPQGLPGPVPPPADRLPGPLSEAQRMEFDRLRTQGILLYRAGRYAEAERSFRAALAIRPDDTITKAWLRAARQAQGLSPD